jgi:hypothetical protein
MISFMLEQVSWIAVFVAAIVGVGIGLLWHIAFGGLCKYDHECCNECERCCDGHSHKNHNHKSHEDNHCKDCHCKSLECILWHKLSAFIFYFAQAYGLAYILERLNLLGNLQDAILMALFVGVTLSVSHLYAAGIWHRGGCMHSLCKALYKLFILVVMAWIFVYFAGMAKNAFV